jgi:CubicO group peptidase (beta-lactamase class C family)
MKTPTLTRLSAVMVGLGAILCSAQPVAPDSGILTAAMKPFLDKGTFAGAVLLVADRTKVLDVEAMGYSDIEHKVPMKTDAEFWIASQSKAMTTAAFMMLVDEGKINLDDPVEKYLPEFHGQTVEADSAAAAPKEGDNVDSDAGAAHNHTRANLAVRRVPAVHPITIREIMSHTSGLPGRSAEEKNPIDAQPLRVAVHQYGTEPLVFQPGSTFFYSNEGINTAGRIIEVVSGMPYEDFMQKRLFDPLGMTHTTFWPTPEEIARLPKIYGGEGKDLVEKPMEQLRRPYTDHEHRFPIPAGGLFSDAFDVARFCQMLLDGGAFQGKRLLSEKAVAAITHKETPPNVHTPYGFGMYEETDGFRHGGALKSEMYVDTQHGLVRIFMIQKTGAWRGPEYQDLKKAFGNAAIAVEKADVK